MYLPSPNGLTDIDYFKLRSEGKVYVSRIFSYRPDEEKIRTVRTVYENSDQIGFSEIEGAVQLKLSPAGKIQVAAVVTQDNNDIRRLTISKLKKLKRNNTFIGEEEESFTFNKEQFNRMLQFLHALAFIDLTNLENFQIEDRSTQQNRKAIVDKSDADLIASFSNMTSNDRNQFLLALKGNLSQEEISLLLGRKDNLRVFRAQMDSEEWKERNWQEFFEKNFWIFGYGLDYRVMGLFDREVTVGHGGTANK
jgi:hypothetical protein